MPRKTNARGGNEACVPSAFTGGVAPLCKVTHDLGDRPQEIRP